MNTTTPKTRAALAVAMIITGQTNSRSFDDLFEQGDGTQVVCHIIDHIRQNEEARIAVANWHGGRLIDGMPAAWVETYNNATTPEQ